MDGQKNRMNEKCTHTEKTQIYAKLPPLSIDFLLKSFHARQTIILHYFIYFLIFIIFNSCIYFLLRTYMTLLTHSWEKWWLKWVTKMWNKMLWIWMVIRGVEGILMKLPGNFLRQNTGNVIKLLNIFDLRRYSFLDIFIICGPISQLFEFWVIWWMVIMGGGRNFEETSRKLLKTKHFTH